MKLSVKEEQKQTREQQKIKAKVRYLLARTHSPLLVKEGTRASNISTVPVGRRFARLAAALAAPLVPTFDI